MKRSAALLLASTAACALACAPVRAQTFADNVKAALGSSGFGLYSFGGITGLGYFDGTSAKPKLVPMPFSLLIGTAAPSQLPLPTTTTVGAVLAGTAASHQFLTAIGTTGGLTFTQPAFTDISGTASVAQGGTGATTLSGLVKGNGTSAFTAAVAGTDYLTPSGNVSATTLNSVTYAPSGLLAWLQGMGTWSANGFVSNIPNTVFVAAYVTDLTCAADQTVNINKAIAAAGAGGYLEFPRGCMTISSLNYTTTNSSAVSSSTTVPVASISNLAVGQQMTFIGLTVPVTVTAIGTSSVTVSAAVTIPNGTTLSFGTFLVGLAGQHWHGAGAGIETSDTYWSPAGYSQSNMASNNSSTAGTHLRFDNATGTAIQLVGSGARIEGIWLTDNVATATITATVGYTNSVLRLHVSAVSSGTIANGSILSGSQIVADQQISYLPGGPTGGTGDYLLTSIAGNVSVGAQGVESTSETMYASPQAIGFQLGEKNEPNGTQALNPSAQELDNIRTEGFGVGTDVQSGGSWRIRNFEQHGWGLYGIRVRNFNYPDSGDGTILTGTLYGGTSAIDGVRWEFGGGLKMGFTKILGGQNGFETAVPDSLTYTVSGASSSTTVATSTSDMFLDMTNSFENQTVSAITLGCNGPNGTANPNGLSTKPTGGLIAGSRFDIQMAGLSNATGSGFIGNGCAQGVDVGGTWGGVLNGIVINGGSYYDLHPRTLANIYSVGINIASGVLGSRISYMPRVTFNKSAGGGWYNILDSRNALTDGVSDDNSVDRQDTRSITTTYPAGSTYTNLYNIGVPAYQGAHVTIEIEGIIQNVGHYHQLYDALLDNTGSATVAPTVLTNTGTNSQIDLQVLQTGSSYQVNFRANGSTSTSNTFTGSLNITVKGHTNVWQIE